MLQEWTSRGLRKHAPASNLGVVFLVCGRVLWAEAVGGWSENRLNRGTFGERHWAAMVRSRERLTFLPSVLLIHPPQQFCLSSCSSYAYPELQGGSQHLEYLHVFWAVWSVGSATYLAGSNRSQEPQCGFWDLWLVVTSACCNCWIF